MLVSREYRNGEFLALRSIPAHARRFFGRIHVNDKVSV
jgi:hypothetical protein